MKTPFYFFLLLFLLGTLKAQDQDSSQNQKVIRDTTLIKKYLDGYFKAHEDALPEKGFSYSGFFTPARQFFGITFSNSVNKKHTKEYGFSIYIETKVRKDSATHSFAVSQIISRDVYGYPLTDTLTMTVKSHAKSAAKFLILKTNYRWLPEELKLVKQSGFLKYSSGLFFGTAGEAFIDLKKTHTQFEFGNTFDNLDTSRTFKVKSPGFNRAFWVQTLEGGFYLSIHPLNFYIYGDFPIICLGRKKSLGPFLGMSLGFTL